MFKKTLLALALAGVAGIANAGTIATTSKDISIEGNATAANAGKIDAADLTAIVLTPKSDYITNDLVILKVTGATFDAAATPTATSSNTSAAKFDFVDFSDANTARFRVSQFDHSKDDTITFGGFKLVSGTPANKQKVTVSTNAISVNPLIGNYDVSKAVEVAQFVNQLSYVVGKLDGVVSTGKGRAQFTGSTPLADTLTLTATDKTSAVDKITFTKQQHVLKGDFSYFADYDLVVNGGNANNKLEQGELLKAMTINGLSASPVVSVDAGLSTVTIKDASAPGTVTVTFNVIGQKNKGSVLKAPQSFTVESSASDASTNVALAAASAGAWTLDGSTDDIELMPFGAEYAQSITVANRGSVEGAITVTLKADGKTYSKELTAKATANNVTNISLEVAAFAAASGITGNAHVNVVVNAPAGNIGVKGVYYHKASADRVLTH